MNLRVYRRDAKEIILFWDMSELTEEQKKCVKICRKDGGQDKELQFKIVPVSDITKDDRGNATAAIISHADNDLNPDEMYTIHVVLGDKEVVESYLKVMAAGTLPMFAKDKQVKHIQVFGWADEKQKWAKVPLIQVDKQWAIPVVIIGDLRKEK